MKKNVTIEAVGLGKKYRIGSRETYFTLRDKLAAMVKVSGRKKLSGGEKGQELWALRKVGFEIGEGEVVGVIGRNGAGKSTLLKILAEITPPTQGEVLIRGRVASLLEVGTGFSMELTGRENIFLNGSILGMSRREIRKKLEEMVEFSGVEKFIDTPVKRYSSGMYVRLAFAVAAHLDPDILLVDEVLAVGDAEFQKKSLGKMSEVARGGRTVVFVSHNMTAIEGLCDRVIWLDGGRVKFVGGAREGVRRYLRSTSSRNRNEYRRKRGDGESMIRRVKVLLPKGKEWLDVTKNVEIKVELCNISRDGVDVMLVVIDEQGLVLFSTSSANTVNRDKTGFGRGNHAMVCTVPGNLLKPGDYGVSTWVMQNKKRVVEQLDDVVMFSVADNARVRGGYFAKVPGVVRPMLDWKVVE